MSDHNDIYSNRDRIMGEINERSRNTDLKLDVIADWCKSHDAKDDKRFMYLCIGLVIVAFGSGVLGQLLGSIKIGL